ncbi:hypothetical protein J2X11_002059 [Aeromicrobium panaciterrae]|uniref:SnoaL-like domain-containing protein n=1 Tax=Aeromicrobium panaciterrae TaxID=363861 RepID=A0ABU1UPZ4_9ACTN|nr:hypothetical protein [Aeromicrobium panaciterrae]MDR7087220.1 hypothetical protein [Aeromicrobium panaciterrae]
MDWILAWVAAIAALAGSDEVHWAGVLGELDDVRAQAFANADPALLSEAYVRASSARKADAALIRDYRSRGAQVVGADFIVLSCKVKSASADRVSLIVVDRLAPAHVEWDDGTTRRLPRDLPTRRVVTLILTSHGWRIEN